MVGLDELFDAAPAPTKRRGPVVVFSPGWWLRRSLAALGTSAAIFLVLYVLRFGVPFPLILAGVLAVMVLRAVLNEVAGDALPTEVTGAGFAPEAVDDLIDPQFEVLRHSVQPTDGIRFAVGRWDDRLIWGERDLTRFRTVVVPRIGELVDERLRQRHGFTRTTEQAKARSLLGEELWAFLHNPLSRVPGPRDVASIVAKVEEL